MSEKHEYPENPENNLLLSFCRADEDIFQRAICSLRDAEKLEKCLVLQSGKNIQHKDTNLVVFTT